MYLFVTRSFPPELGGMQSLMWGLARELSKNFMIKVFADYIENHKSFDEQASFSIERVGGPKLLRKYRKAYLIDEFVKECKMNSDFTYYHFLYHIKQRTILQVSYGLFKHVNEASTDEVTKNMSEYLNENAPELKLDAANNTIQ